MISMRTGTDGAGGSEAGRNGKRTRMMAALLAGAFLSLMAETFLNNALPTIMKDFAVSQSTAQWLSTAYLLVVGLMIPILAWIFSSFQSRTTYMAMMAVFLLGSLVCVFSTGHFALLLTGRIIQAAAAGSLMPFIQNVVLLLFPPERRGLALGVVGLVVALGPTVGPTMSGFILQHWSWRALFILLATVSMLVLLAAFFFVYTVNQPRKAELDLVSVILSCLGFGCLLYALSVIGDTGRFSPHHHRTAPGRPGRHLALLPPSALHGAPTCGPARVQFGRLHADDPAQHLEQHLHGGNRAGTPPLSAEQQRVKRLDIWPGHAFRRHRHGHFQSAFRRTL